MSHSHRKARKGRPRLHIKSSKRGIYFAPLLPNGEVSMDAFRNEYLPGQYDYDRAHEALGLNDLKELLRSHARQNPNTTTKSRLA